MKKLLSIFLTLFVFTLNVQAKSSKGDFASIIKDSGISKDSIAISVRNADNGKVVYSLNDKIMMNPASIQKVLTMTSALDALGEDYKFKTELYLKGEDIYLIKLSGDPYLRYNDLKFLTKPVRGGAKQIYIDDSVLDDNCWGAGWQWDDDMNVLMPRFGAYNLDSNLIKLILSPSESGQFAKISNPSKYPLVFLNNITTSNITKLDIKRDSAVSDNTLKLGGTIARQTTVNIPSNNLKRYFEIRLTQALGENRIYLKTPFLPQKLTSEYTIQESFEHGIDVALNDILKNSNNMSAETVFKLSGGDGTVEKAIQKFNEFCESKKLDSSVIKITDGSGVSKNNLVTADFVSDFLYRNSESPVMTYLPTPGQGTLVQRMLPIKENLRAKTGTLVNISSIAGYLTTKKGNNYTFCIIQNDVKLSSAEKKILEEYIIREAYLKL